VSARIRVGQVVTIAGQSYRVAERQRGRAGEERDMYVLERHDANGNWYRSETRCRSALLRHIEASA